MTIPHTFVAGEIAQSSEVNENFDHVLNTVGPDSDEEHLRLLGDIRLGPRHATQITADGDGGPGAESGYLQLSWNAELYDTGGGVYRLRRYVDNEGASAVRVGNQGVEVLATHNTTSELTNAMDTVLAVRPHEFTPYIYVNNKWAFSDEDVAQTPGTRGAYRLQLVLIDPQSVISSSTGNADTVYSASQFGVPEHAKAIHAWARVQGHDPSFNRNKVRLADARIVTIHIRTEQEGVPDEQDGLLVAGGMSVPGYGQGPVSLGYAGTYKGKFHVTSVGEILDQEVWITGYYV